MNMSNDDDKFMNYWYSWFVGFVDGEGYFCISKRNHTNLCANHECAFQIRLRDDDKPILEEIHDTLGFGNISDYPVYPSYTRNARPQTSFRVSAIADCAKLVEIFERFPLRAKKKRDFSIWRCAVFELQKPVSDRNADLLEYYFHRIKQVRQYEVSQEIPKPIVVETQLTIDF